jgi:hypothetical protein
MFFQNISNDLPDYMASQPRSHFRVTYYLGEFRFLGEIKTLFPQKKKTHFSEIVQLYHVIMIRKPLYNDTKVNFTA